MATAPGLAPGRRWQAPFAVVWGGQAVSSIGSTLAQFGLIWWLTVTTGSGTTLALAGMNATLDGLTRIVAAPLGALLLGIVGVYGLLAIDVATAAVAIAPLLALRLPQLGRIAPGRRRPSLVRELGEGLRYLLGQRGLFLIFATATAAMLFLVAPLNLVPLLVSAHLHGGAMDLGYVESAYGWGYLAGGAILSAWGGFKRRMVTSVLGQAGLALGILAMGLVPADGLWLAVVAWCFAGLMLPIATGPLQAIYQSLVPPAMLGRVLALNTSMLNLATPIGLAIGGPLADRFGVQGLFLAAGVATLAVAAVRALSPAVMALDVEVAQGD